MTSHLHSRSMRSVVNQVWSHVICRQLKPYDVWEHSCGLNAIYRFTCMISCDSFMRFSLIRRDYSHGSAQVLKGMEVSRRGHRWCECLCAVVHKAIKGLCVWEGMHVWASPHTGSECGWYKTKTRKHTLLWLISIYMKCNFTVLTQYFMYLCVWGIIKKESKNANVCVHF